MTSRAPVRKRPSPPAFELRSPLGLHAELCRLSTFLTDTAAAQVGRLALAPDAAVHETRLVVKRFRALLRLLRHALGTRPAALHIRRLRRAARGLAEARDTAVGLKTLGDLGHGLRGSTAAAVRDVRKRYSAETRTHEPTARAVARQLRRAIAAVRQTAADLTQTPLRLQGWRALEPALRKDYRRVRRRYKAAHTEDDEERFHRWRTATKSFMYQLRLLRPAAPRRIGELLKGWDALQEVLGQENDLAVVRSRIDASGTTTSRPAANREVDLAITNRQQRLRKVALKLGRRLLRTRAAEFTRELHRDWNRWRKTRPARPGRTTGVERTGAPRGARLTA